MKTKLTQKRLLASLLAVAVLLSALVCFTIPAYADGESETPVNLLRTDPTHLSSIKSVSQNKQSGVVTYSGNFTSLLNALYDGNTTKENGVGSFGAAIAGSNPSDGTSNGGVEITLDKAYTLSELVLYQGHGTYPDYVKVYASEKLADLYKAESLITTEDVEMTGFKEIPATVKAKYIAILTTKVTEMNMARLFEYEIYGLESTGTEVVEGTDETTPSGGETTPSGGETDPSDGETDPSDGETDPSDGETDPSGGGSDAETPVNLLDKSKNHVTEIKGVLQNKENSDVTYPENTFNAMIAIINDGDTTTKQDVGSFGADIVGSNPIAGTSNGGVQITLDKAYTLSKLVLYQGHGTYPDYVKVYASEKLADLYKEESLITTEDVEMKALAAEIPTTVKAKYIAILTTATTSMPIARFYEYEIYGLESTGTEVEEDLGGGDTEEDPHEGINLRDYIGSAAGLLQDVSSGTVTEDNRFNGNGAMDIIFDGVTDVHKDVYGALDWEYPKYVGVRFALSDPIEVEKLVIYSGLSAYKDTLKIYASSQLGNLYADSNLIKENVVCNGEAQEIAIGKEIQYVAIFITNEGTWRPKEFALYAAEGTELPEVDQGGSGDQGGDSSNASNLKDHISKVQGLLQDINGGAVNEDERFNGNGAAATIIDGDLETQVDVYGAADWEYPKYVGVRMELDDLYNVEKLVLHSGTAGYPDTMKVYASDSLSNLYSSASLIAENVVAQGNAATVTVGKDVQYIAIFITDYNGCWRTKEFEVYGGAATGDGGSDGQGGSAVTPDNHENILLNMVPDNGGVTAGTDYETLGGTGGPYGFEGLTDGLVLGTKPDVGDVGKEQNVQFWNGKNADGTLNKFVFTYDLEKNYDLSKVYVDAWADYEDEGVHQGIESWDFYASRNREDLFKAENKITGKTGYDDPSELAKALSLKNIRYVSFVFTIQDTRYGTCRLTELELYGVESAEQDSDKPGELPDEYLDLETDGDVVVRIHGLDETDDLSQLEIEAVVEKITSAADLSAVAEKLDNRYVVKGLFTVSLTDSDGYDAELEGRAVSLLIPVDSEDYLAAVVDAVGADLLSVKFVDGYMVIDVVNNGTYALMTASGTQGGTPDDNDPDASTPDESDPDASTPDASDPSNPDTGVNGAAGFAALAVLSAAVLFVSKKAKKN